VKKSVKIVLPILILSIATTLLIVGYITGNPMVVKLLGGNEVDIALKQGKLMEEENEGKLEDSGTKNYQSPLPKYSYLSEDEANMIANPGFSSDDSIFYKAFPELLQARDTLVKVK
jgi:hypothetical protein